MVPPPSVTAPLLIADDPALDRYLLDIHGKNFASHVESGGVDLATWLASGEDADERSFQDAQRLGLPLLRLPDVAVDSATAALLPPQQARRLRVVPMRLHNGLLAVAMEDPTNAEALAAVEFATTRHVLPLVATGRGIREAIARCYDQVEDRETVRKLGLDPLATVADNEAEARRLAREQPVVRLVHDLIADAVVRRASDIHLRPGEHATDVLYRIDDELVPVRSLMRALHPAAVSRIKVLGGMNLAEHRTPQDGRTSFTLDDGTRVDLRISILPTVLGESAVVRLLDSRQSLWDLDQLGLTEVTGYGWKM